jgi:hypothetical protein
VIYWWGLRRTETSKLDLADWGRNPAAAEFGRYGMLNVRYGKAKKGQPPRRRNVASVMGWAVEAVADYVENVWSRFGCEDHPALWVTERGGRIKPAEINARFTLCSCSSRWDTRGHRPRRRTRRSGRTRGTGCCGPRWPAHFPPLRIRLQAIACRMSNFGGIVSLRFL